MTTLIHRLHQWAQEEPQAIAQKVKVDGQWKEITCSEYFSRVYWVSLYLEEQGFEEGDVSSIFSYNLPQWVYLDLAPSLLGGLSAGLYPNSSADDISHVFELTRAKVLGVQNETYYQNILKLQGWDALPEHIEKVIVFEGDASFCDRAISFEEVLQQGKALAKAKNVQSYLDRLDPDRGAFLIFTSGTTGKPKGAVLSHDNFTFISDRVSEFWKVGTHGSVFSFLPLCHVAEKLQNLAVGISQKLCVNYCSSFDQVAVELKEVQPTMLLCVPRLWEKMMDTANRKIRSESGMKKKMLELALEVGRSTSEKIFSEKPLGLSDVLGWKLADQLILSKVKEAMGLGKVKTCASGAALLSPQVEEWFRCLGVNILNDYGQTESTGVICMTEPGKDSSGTIGVPVPGLDFKLAEDGEILTRGRHVFKGYYKNPEATAETVRDGWLHTGDLGEQSEDGLVRIIGRKKEILKTSGGKMVAPAPLEEGIKACEIVSQACVVGDGRKYISVLITLTEEKMAEIGTCSEEVINEPSVLEMVQFHVSRLNSGLASFEQIKYFKVLSREFSIESGEMTPTLKMKRSVVEKNYDHIIKQMY